MRILIPAVGDTQKPFGNTDNKKFLTLAEYEREAKSVIGFVMRGGNLSYKFKKDDDIVSYVQYELMKADANYKPEHSLSMASYRFSCGVFAVKKLIHSHNNKRNKAHQEYIDNVHSNQSTSPYSMQDEFDKLINKLDKICNKNEKQIFMQVMLQDESISQVARNTGYTRMGVYNIIKRVQKRLGAHYSEILSDVK